MKRNYEILFPHSLVRSRYSSTIFFSRKCFHQNLSIFPCLAHSPEHKWMAILIRLQILFEHIIFAFRSTFVHSTSSFPQLIFPFLWYSYYTCKAENNGRVMQTKCPKWEAGLESSRFEIVWQRSLNWNECKSSGISRKIEILHKYRYPSF